MSVRKHNLYCPMKWFPIACTAPLPSSLKKCFQSLLWFLALWWGWGKELMWFFETGSHVLKAGCRLPVWLKMTLNSCLYVPVLGL